MTLYGVLLSSFGLMLATLSKNILGQSFLLLILLFVIVISQFGIYDTIQTSLDINYLSTSQNWLGLGILTVIVIALSELLQRVAAGRIAAISENRTTGVRICLWIVQAVWIAGIFGMAIYQSDHETITMCCYFLSIYWFFAGLFSMTESERLSPRVRRHLPRTSLTSSLFRPLFPGATAGYYFCSLSGAVSVLAIGAFGSQFEFWNAPPEPLVFSAYYAGMLTTYLGVCRLVTLPLGRRGWLSPLTALVIGGSVLLSAVLLPVIAEVLVHGSVTSHYGTLNAFDWYSTLIQAYEYSSLPAELALLPLLFGLILICVNAFLSDDYYRYRRVSVPVKVRQAAASSRGAVRETESQESLSEGLVDPA